MKIMEKDSQRKIGDDKITHILRKLYEVERTLSFILQSYTYVGDLVQSNTTLKTIVHDHTGARDQLREIMRSMGWNTNF